MTDVSTGEPIAGVSVLADGSAAVTATDDNGQYSFVIPQNSQSLTFRYLGYVSQTTPLNASNVVDVTLSPNTSELEEVVVTALGIARPKNELSYAATSINNETLTQVNAVNAINGLQGKVSGLNVTTISSGVFEDVNINLRGIRSLTGNNDPLLVLDGVPTPISYFSSLNPNDIENVSVLKGSSSAGIYGPDARNGVIVVTTKRGSDTPVITVSHATQFQNISFFPKLQKEFGSGGYGSYIPYENWSWGPAYDGSTKEIGHELPDGSVQTVVYSATDERQDFFDTGVTMQNDVSLSSKGFFLSLQDANIKGIVPGDKNRRTSVRLNATREYGKFDAGMNVNYSQMNYKVFHDEGMGDYFTAQNVGGNDGIMAQIFNTPAHIPLSKYKNFETDPFADYNGYYNDYGLNPYFAIDNWRREGKRQDVLANLRLGYKPTDWLSFTYMAGLTSQTRIDRNYSKGEVPNEYGLGRSFTLIPGTVEEQPYAYTRLSSELFGQLDKQLDGDFRLKAILGTYVRQTEFRNTEVGAGNLVVPELYNIGNRTGSLSGASTYSQSRLFSVYGSAALSYKGWANVEFTGRNDQTSLLAMGNNSYFYPGVSGSVLLSDAIPGFKSNAFSYLKLRGAWNKTGNAEISPYSLAAIYTQPAYTGFPFGSLPGFTAGNTTYDANLNPEFVNSTEAGIESGFLNGRITLEATYFYQKNTDQIISVRTSDATGYNFANLNAASFINKGIEMDLGLSPLIKFQDGGVHFRANATYNNSEVIGVYPGLDEVSIGGYVASGNVAVIGKPAFVIRATDYLRDDEGRIIVDRVSGYPSVDPNSKDFGRTLPLWIVGLNPSVQWKGFNLSALFEYKGGHYASFFAMGSDMSWTGVGEATALNHRERFVLPNSSYEDPANPGTYLPNTDITVANVNDFFTGVYRDAASNFITSAAAWRMRELSLSYDFPEHILARLGVVKGLSVALTGRNLFIWVPKENKFSDPDFNSVNEDYPNTFGIVNSVSYPPVRNFGFNVNLRF
ncbi:SusC/RagA family TonB-linked outer membrane protein [Parapedobacter defluvii]|uniref:SusC/RagA family TonB-linked outer membrane protein n=1 Tax=Parapedobacter defluvii TaxID=2045106 RepID=A0ABQ1LC03_9SPHI|nr:SusC/RagA family TonB-linked outer membrane protein [Parapedobacter defluvii]